MLFLLYEIGVNMGNKTKMINNLTIKEIKDKYGTPEQKDLGLNSFLGKDIQEFNKKRAIKPEELALIIINTIKDFENKTYFTSEDLRNNILKKMNITDENARKNRIGKTRVKNMLNWLFSNQSENILFEDHKLSDFKDLWNLSHDLHKISDNLYYYSDSITDFKNIAQDILGLELKIPPQGNYLGHLAEKLILNQDQNNNPLSDDSTNEIDIKTNIFDITGFRSDNYLYSIGGRIPSNGYDNKDYITLGKIDENYSNDNGVTNLTARVGSLKGKAFLITDENNGKKSIKMVIPKIGEFEWDWDTQMNLFQGKINGIYMLNALKSENGSLIAEQLEFMKGLNPEKYWDAVKKGKIAIQMNKKRNKAPKFTFQVYRGSLESLYQEVTSISADDISGGRNIPLSKRTEHVQKILSTKNENLINQIKRWEKEREIKELKLQELKKQKESKKTNKYQEFLNEKIKKVSKGTLIFDKETLNREIGISKNTTIKENMEHLNKTLKELKLDDKFKIDTYMDDIRIFPIKTKKTPNQTTVNNKKIFKEIINHFNNSNQIIMEIPKEIMEDKTLANKATYTFRILKDMGLEEKIGVSQKAKTGQIFLTIRNKNIRKINNRKKEYDKVIQDFIKSEKDIMDISYLGDNVQSTSTALNTKLKKLGLREKYKCISKTSGKDKKLFIQKIK